MVDPAVQKLTIQNARLRADRDKGIAIKASGLLREAMTLLERMEPQPGLTGAVDHLTQAVDALVAWTPRGGR